MTTTATVRDAPDEHRYEVVVDDDVAGFSDYRLEEGRIAFLHTEVGDAYAGQGLGKKLVTEMLDDVDHRGLEVVPLCPFVRKVISDDASRYLRLVPDDRRTELGLDDLDT